MVVVEGLGVTNFQIWDISKIKQLLQTTVQISDVQQAIPVGESGIAILTSSAKVYYVDT